MLDATGDESDLSKGLVHRTAEKLSTTISKMAGRREITDLEQSIILTPRGSFQVHLCYGTPSLLCHRRRVTIVNLG
jgi:hypothetical protein